MSAGHQLREALRADKKERSSITAAKAVLIDSFLNGYNKPDWPAKELYGMARGPVTAIVFGASLADKQSRDKLTADHTNMITRVITLAADAAVNHREYLEHMVANFGK